MEHRFVFLAGLHRSGTTLLARLLAAHPDISGLSGTGVPADEGQHLQSVYPAAKVYGGPGRFGFAPESGSHLVYWYSADERNTTPHQHGVGVARTVPNRQDRDLCGNVTR